MSTPTPRTDRILGGIIMSAGSRRDVELMELELTAALARIAELEKLERRVCKWVQARSITEDAPAGDLIQRMNDHDERRLLRLDHYEREIDSLTRQLSESQAQLASAREDGARLDEVQKRKFTIYWNVRHDGFVIQEREQVCGNISNDKDLRAAIDAALVATCTNHFSDGSKIFPQRDCCSRHLAGRTETPAGGETGKASTELIDSQETECWQPFQPMTPAQYGTFKTSWGETCSAKVYGTIDDSPFDNGIIALINYMTEGRLVTGAMVPLSSITFVSSAPLPPPPQGKEQGE